MISYIIPMILSILTIFMQYLVKNNSLTGFLHLSARHSPAPPVKCRSQEADQQLCHRKGRPQSRCPPCPWQNESQRQDDKKSPRQRDKPSRLGPAGRGKTGGQHNIYPRKQAAREINPQPWNGKSLQTGVPSTIEQSSNSLCTQKDTGVGRRSPGPWRQSKSPTAPTLSPNRHIIP